MSKIQGKSQSPASQSAPQLSHITKQLEQIPEVHAAYEKYVEIKKLEPKNATQLTKFCSQQGIGNVKYSQASKYFRIKAGLSSDSLSQHSKPSRMYSKYYNKTKKMRQSDESGPRRTSFTSGVTQYDTTTTTASNRPTKHRMSEPFLSQNSGVIGVDLETLVDDYNASKKKNNDDSSNDPTTPATPATPFNASFNESSGVWDNLTQEEKREIRQTKLKFQRENKKKRESVYLAMAASATDEHVEEVYDEADAAEAASIQDIQENVQKAFKALVGSMKSHGTRLTQSKEQLEVIDKQMDAAKQLIVKEFDVAMGTLLKRRNGLLKALEVAHEENTKTLKKQIKSQQEASNKLLACKDQCKQHIANHQTKEAIEAVVKVLTDVRPDEAELANVNIEYKQTEPKLNDYLENYGTVSVAKTVRRGKKSDANDNNDDAKADE